MTEFPFFPPDDADDPILDYSKRLHIDPPLSCQVSRHTAQGTVEPCGKPAPIGRIWPEVSSYLLLPHCEECDAAYERAYADQQPPEKW